MVDFLARFEILGRGCWGIRVYDMGGGLIGLWCS